MQRIRTLAATVGAAAVLAGCAAGATASAPSWVPKPSFAGEGQGGSVPGQVSPPPGSTPTGGPSSGSGSAKKGQDPNVVATKLDSPVGLTLLPDGTALVGERRTGRIVRVQPTPGRPVPTVRVIRGIDASGDGGLLDLALSPNYTQDGLIFAYLTTAKDNRVVDFTLNGPVTPVLTGIPKGRLDNSGRLMFGADGDLYVGTSDAGRPALAADPASLAGKVLRITDIGKPAAGNPNPKSPVFASGQHVVVGLCLDDDSAGAVFTVDADGPRGSARVDLLRPGAFYGWPHGRSAAQQPVTTPPAADTSPGGCAVIDSTLYVSSLDATAVLAGDVSTATRVSVAPLRPVISKKYGRLRTVVGAPDGALWITTSNKDGHGKPVAADERVLRIQPSGGAASTFPG